MVFKSKKELFQNERKEFIKKLLDLLEVKKSGDSFCLNLILNNNPEKNNEILTLANDFNKLYKRRYINLDSSRKNPALILVKNALKQEGYRLSVQEKHFKLSPGEYKNLKVYTIR